MNFCVPRAACVALISVCCLPSCLPLPGEEPKKTKAELAATAPVLEGVTVEKALEAFPDYTVSNSSDETADLHTAVQTFGESSATATIVSYAPEKVASIAIAVHRPGNANGPMLDRLAAEYLPKALVILPDDRAGEARSWLVEELMRMSSSGHNAKTKIGNVELSLNVIRSKATLRLSPVAPAKPSGGD